MPHLRFTAKIGIQVNEFCFIFIGHIYGFVAVVSRAGSTVTVIPGVQLGVQLCLSSGGRRGIPQIVHLPVVRRQVEVLHKVHMLKIDAAKGNYSQ